jgi:hypothetical protein
LSPSRLLDLSKYRNKKPTNFVSDLPL